MFKNIQVIQSEHSGIKLAINNKDMQKISNCWGTKLLLINNPWVKEDIKKKNTNCFQLYKTENTAYQNLWDVDKAILKGKFTTLKHLYQGKKERFQTNDFRQINK